MTIFTFTLYHFAGNLAKGARPCAREAAHGRAPGADSIEEALAAYERISSIVDPKTDAISVLLNEE